MFKIIIVSLLFLALIASQPRPSLLPYPKSISYGSQRIIVNPCSIVYHFSPTSQVLAQIPGYFQKILQFFHQKTFPKYRCSLNLIQNTIRSHLVEALKQEQEEFILVVQLKNVEILAPALPSPSTNESYKLKISSNEGVLEADNYHGFLRGVESFYQLLEESIDDGKYSLNYVPLIIDDSPSLSYRGVMLDTARHYLQIETIKHVLDGMFFHKLNVFHWHITDEESFPMELESFPEITASAKYSAQEVYSREDIANIIDYARLRGIRVIPEIDSPAHSLSWSFSPNLSDIALRCPIWANYNGQLDPTLNKTYEVVKGIFDDVAASFSDEYLHLGGDEVSYSCWEEKPWIKKFMSENNITSGIDLQNYYKKREKRLVDPQKSTIFWVKDSNFEYEPNDILQYWGSTNDYNLIENYTNPVILSPCDYLYIDVGYGNVFGDNSWEPLITWKTIYGFNPLPKEIERSRILGAEVTLWAEVNSDSTTDNHLWSRSSAFAERVWNPEINNGIKDIVARLYANEKRLIRRGFYPSPITSEYCSKHIDVCFN